MSDADTIATTSTSRAAGERTATDRVAVAHVDGVDEIDDIIDEPTPGALRRFFGGRGGLYLGRLLVGLVVLASWELSSGRIWSEFQISKPTNIAGHLRDMASSGELWTHTKVTMTETLVGLAIGLVAGVILGLLIATSKRIGQLFLPYVMALYSLPRVALAPLFVVWFGIGLSAKIVMVITMVVFVAFYNTYEGVRNIDRDLLEMARSMRAPWYQTLRWVILPSITPWLLTSLRLSIGLALIGAVIAELIGSSEGLGYYIKQSSNLFDTTGVFAGLFVVTFIAVVLDQILVFAEKRVLRYREANS